MKELVIFVSKVLGTCTSTPPLRKGDFFTVRDGDIRIPEDRFMCLWALQSVLPLIPAKERRIAERHAEDWMWRVHNRPVSGPQRPRRLQNRAEERNDKAGAEEDSCC